MSAAESKAVIDRLVGIHKDVGAEDFGAYCFLAFGILAHHAPDVATFILDRADDAMGAPDA